MILLPSTFWLALLLASGPPPLPASAPVKPLPMLAVLSNHVAAVVLPSNPPPTFPVLLTWTVGPSTNPQSCVRLETSCDLTNWQWLANFPDTNGSYAYSNFFTGPVRFFRALAAGSYQIVTNLNATNLPSATNYGTSKITNSIMR